MSRFFETYTDHFRVTVRLTPNAGRDGIDGIEIGADGEEWLKARVTAVPEKGKANKALIELLAKTMRVPKTSISVISGDTGRKKILRIDGNPEDLVSKIDKLLQL